MKVIAIALVAPVVALAAAGGPMVSDPNYHDPRVSEPYFHPSPGPGGI